jgi:hypothetical protein
MARAEAGAALAISASTAIIEMEIKQRMANLWPIAVKLKRKAKLWRENIAAGFSNTCNVTATVLNWQGTTYSTGRCLRAVPDTGQG